jgi:hypothetical protein
MAAVVAISGFLAHWIPDCFDPIHDYAVLRPGSFFTLTGSASIRLAFIREALLKSAPLSLAKKSRALSKFTILQTDFFHQLFSAIKCSFSPTCLPRDPQTSLAISFPVT